MTSVGAGPEPWPENETEDRTSVKGGLSSPSGWCLTNSQDSSPVLVTFFKYGIVKRERENALGRTTPHTGWAQVNVDEHETPAAPASEESLSQFGPVEQTALLGQGSALSPPPAEGAVSFCSPKVAHPASVTQGPKAGSQLCPPQLTGIAQVGRPLLQAALPSRSE